MITIAICDDEIEICTQIERMIYNFGYENAVMFSVEIFSSGIELLHFIEKEYRFDIIFLDIEMEGINGVEVGRFIREEQKDQLVQIVYISAKTNYCMELFDIRPMNFLEKPIVKEKIYKLLKLVIELYPGRKLIFRYKQGHVTCKELIRNILYFESHNRIVTIVKETENIEFYSTLTEVQKQIEKSNFLLIHKSFLVNYVHVIEFGSKELKMSNGQILPISQQRRKEVRERQLQIEKELYGI